MPHPRIWAAAVAAVGGTLVAGAAWIGATASPYTSSTSTDALFAAHVTVSAALAAAAILLTVVDVRPVLAILAAALAIVLQAEILRNWGFTPPMARTALAVLIPLAPALAALIAMSPGDVAGASARRSRPVPPILRVATRAGVAAIALIALGIALVRVPLLDVTCRFDCGLPTWVPMPMPSAVAPLDVGYGAAVAATALIAAVTVGVAVRNGSSWMALLMGGAATVVLVVEAARALPAWDATAVNREWIDAVRLGALGMLALAVAVSGLVAARHVLAVRELADRLGHETEPGELRDRLATILADDALSLGFWVPDADDFVDRDGVPVRQDREATRVELSRRGRPLALVVTNRPADEVRSSLSRIGASARLAIDNERLYAELRYRARATESTRRQIVERSASERHAIERGLHDRAQAGLVAALFELARLRAADGDSAEAIRLEHALTRAHARMRELAHGVYPALLDGLGLSESLRELGTSRPLSVTGAAGRLPPRVEHALYRLVRAVAEGGAPLVVDIAIDDEVTMTVSGVRSGAPAVIIDELAVLGGRVDHRDGTLTAVVPCAP